MVWRDVGLGVTDQKVFENVFKGEYTFLGSLLQEGHVYG